MDEIFARVLYDYVPEVQESDPASALLSVEKDSYLRILNNDDPSWWLAQKLNKDEIGWLPGHFVELVNSTEALQSLEKNETPQTVAQETTPAPAPVVNNTNVGNSNRHSILNKRITSQPTNNVPVQPPAKPTPTPTPAASVASPSTGANAKAPPKRPARDNIPTNSPKDVRASQRNLTPVQKTAVRAQFNTKQRSSSSFPIRGILDRFLVSRSSQQALVERNILISEVHPENPIPLRKDLVQDCISYIESKALNEEGVYRISGHATEVRKLCNSFRGDFDLTKIEDPHIVIGAMKMYFREMVPPLIPFELYNTFLDSHQYEEDLQKCINALRDAVDKLPALNKEILQMLCKHLCNVAKNSSKNLMTPPNLAIVFGPNLLRPKRQDLKTTLYLDKNSEIVRNCIEFYEDVFVEKKVEAPAPVTNSRSNTLTSPPPGVNRERPVPPASIRKAGTNSTSTSASQLPAPIQAITVVSESFALARLQSALHDKIANSIAAIVEQEVKNADLTSKDKQQLIVEVLKDKDNRIKELESLIYKMEASKSKQSTSFYANRAKNIDAMLCLQCGHNNRTALFLDCQHFAFCSKCADGFQGICPLCNEAISSVRHLNVQ